MMNNNKILTVSYGTFSCTLEGFDDSFGTMKAIAEYFRDLSADDRYFGSEPIQPDAQMLARIAEREISRHVEAREDQGRIVLSAQAGPRAAAQIAETMLDDVADAVADATVAKAPTAIEEAPATAGADPVEEAEADDQTVPAPEEAPAAVQTAEADLPAADVTPSDAAPETDIVPSLPDDEVGAFFAESAQTGPAAPEEEDTPNAPEQDRAKADSIADKLKRIRAVVSQQAEAAQAPDYSEDQHADAAVTPAEKITDLIADPVDEIAAPDSNDVLADTLRDLEDALEADDEIEIEDTARSDDDMESEDDDVAAILSRLESEADTGEMPEDPAPVSAPPAAEADDDNPDDSILAATDTGGADDPDDLDDLDDENLFEEEHDEASAPVEPAASDPVQAAPAAPRTRVLKVKRATLDAAIQAGQLEEYDDETPAATVPPAPPKAPLAQNSTLTDEAEADLARELAELEAEMKAEDEAAAARRKAQIARETALKAEAAKAEAAKAEAARAEAARAEAAEAEALETAVSDAETLTGAGFDQTGELEEDTVESEAGDSIEDEVEAATADDAPDAPEEDAAQSARAEITGSTDRDFSRLMEESNQQMQEPEAATRRDAFAHLRAAVAAKKADEAAGGAAVEEETDEAYRDDLANVVRPRRPVSSGERPRTERPAEARPAPLKLVAEQRIDVATPRTSVPVRPRRVSAVASVPTAAPETDATSFADFASEMGASKLPDLLEAAAAYLSFVEGHEEFSRPQLMTKVRQVEKDNFTREDSLRSFGKLLREGKIEKLKGGRFQASDQIGFKPDARAAG